LSDTVHVVNVDRLDHERVTEVLALSRTAAAVDEAPPLSEQVLLAVRSPNRDSTAHGSSPTSGSRHFLAYVGKHLAGYAHLHREIGGGPVTAEVVVDPSCRRRGVGTKLIAALKDALDPEVETLQIWAHGHLAGAQAFAAREGYTKGRELWLMSRSLRSDPPLPAVSLPDGFSTRTFAIGQDEDAWLQVNARAFARHPEQGRMTRSDLDLRIAEPWFDATGLILVEDLRGPTAVLAASHWTKVVPPDPDATPTEGEVYVVAVDPAYQGLGLGRAVTVLGLEHLRDRGLAQAILYVDADNTAAVETYTRLGFTRAALDVMYSPAVHPAVPR
jgi:mycothiol synthase